MKLFTKSLLALFLLNSMVNLIKCENNCDLECGQKNRLSPGYVNPKNVENGTECTKYHKLMACYDDACDANSREQHKKSYKQWENCSEDICANKKGLCSGLHSDDWPNYLKQHNISSFDSGVCKSIRENVDCRIKNKCPNSFPADKDAELKECITPADPCDPTTGTIHCTGININNFPNFFKQNNISALPGDFCRKIRENVDCRIENNCSNSFPADKDAELNECITKNDNPPASADPCDPITGTIHCSGISNNNWPIFFKQNNISALPSDFCRKIRENVDCRIKNKCPNSFPNDTDAELKECINKDPCAAANGQCPGFDINWSIFFQYMNVSELGQKACTAIRENRVCRKNNSCPVEKTFPDEKMAELEECIKPKTTENPSNTTAANEAMASTNCLLFLFLANAWIALLTKML